MFEHRYKLRAQPGVGSNKSKSDPKRNQLRMIRVLIEQLGDLINRWHGRFITIKDIRDIWQAISQDQVPIEELVVGPDTEHSSRNDCGLADRT